MKKALYLFMCFLSYGLVSCGDDYEFIHTITYSEKADFHFQIEASKDLLSYSNPIAICTDHFGVTDTIELVKEKWVEIPETYLNKYKYKISKNYDFLPANSKMEIQFVSNGVYPEDVDSLRLYSILSCSIVGITKEGKYTIQTVHSFDTDIDINTEGTESDANENWNYQLKKITRRLEIGMDENGNATRP